MSVGTRYHFDEALVAQLSQQQKEPDWMLQSRLQALHQVAQLPLPRVEKTDITRWNFTDFDAYQTEAMIDRLTELPEEVGQFIFDPATAHVIVQKNASVIFRQVAEELAETGVIFTDFATATREHADLVKTYFMTEAFKKEEHQLTALHAALFSGGLFVYVPRNVEVALPLQGLFWADDAKVGILPHLLLIAEANSRVDLVVNLVGEAAVNHSMIEVFVGENAHVRLATVNNLSDAAVDVTYRRNRVERDGHLDWIVADFSEGRILSDNTTHLQGVGGNVNIKTVTLGAGEMRANITSTIHHWGPRTTSQINARSVMKDSASSILNSITHIEKGASKSDGQQTGKVLMLNAKARGDANPILLIDENDVTAGHAASVGRVDPIQMYYLMSRGISRREAEKLIVSGFLDAVISEIPSAALRQRIHHMLERKFQS
jgi:Fe-S cluster assembly protein SufD